MNSPRSSVVERFLGKEEVMGSIPVVGSMVVRSGWDNLDFISGNLVLINMSRSA